MTIREIDRNGCLQVLASAPVARLACASGGQPYVVPVFLAYHKSYDGDDCLYGFTTLGQKVEWMRANPFVCVEVDQVTSRSEWVSVVAFGTYEELPNVHECTCGREPSRRNDVHNHHAKRFSLELVNEQLFAHRLLEARAMWWEPASTIRNLLTNDDAAGRFAPVFYKIRLTEVTGLEALREPQPAPAVRTTIPEPSTAGWLAKTLRNLVGRRN